MKEGLTYDDVLVVPAYSEVLPHMVTTKTKFSSHARNWWFTINKRCAS